MGVYTNINNGVINNEINIDTPHYSVNLSVSVYTDINNGVINNEINIDTPHYSVNLSWVFIQTQIVTFYNNITLL